MARSTCDLNISYFKDLQSKRSRKQARVIRTRIYDDDIANTRETDKYSTIKKRDIRSRSFTHALCNTLRNGFIRQLPYDDSRADGRDDESSRESQPETVKSKIYRLHEGESEAERESDDVVGGCSKSCDECVHTSRRM